MQATSGRRETLRGWFGAWAALTGAVAAAAAFVWSRGQMTERKLHEARQERITIERQFTGLATRRANERHRLAATDADNQRLIDAIAGGAVPGVAAASKSLTRDVITARYQKAQAMERSGDNAGALTEYLWCYDIGFRAHDLLKRIGRLGEDFAIARQALVERRNRAEARVISSPDDVETMSDLIALNHTLNEDTRTLAVYDRLSASDGLRIRPDRSMLEVFIITKRYGDAMRVLPYDYLKESVERAAKMESSYPAREKAQQEIIAEKGGTEAQRQMQILALQRARQAQRQATIVESAVGVEVLAGAGDLMKAREIARKVFAFDHSAETRLLLQKHAARAGYGDLLEDLLP